MNIAYPSFVVAGQESNQKATSVQPDIKLNQYRYSTLIMYDPDAIVPPYLHFLVINIKNGDINSGDVIVPYAGPTPPPGTGVHRYIFEQLEQQSPFTYATPERAKFDIQKFKAQNNLAVKATKMFHVNA
jgi:phosphatidylethanolamine-binding protein (PEBP) family uncharacterized protein